MSDTLTIEVRKCPHGVWHSHNAYQLEDGTVVDDPEGPCSGGRMTVNGKTWTIPFGLAVVLRDVGGG